MFFLRWGSSYVFLSSRKLRKLSAGFFSFLVALDSSTISIESFLYLVYGLVVKLLLNDLFITLLNTLSFWFSIYFTILLSAFFFWLVNDDKSCVASNPEVVSADLVSSLICCSLILFGDCPSNMEIT